MKQKHKFIAGTLVLAIAAALGFLYLFEAIFYFTFPVVERSPVQPIAFSHRQHAGEYDISCFYCHRYANVSRAAGVPDMELCVSCHRFISREKPAVETLISYWERREPVPWLRVHDLPDFVYFPHKTHVRAGIYCDSCHGNVAAMDRIERVQRLSMRWCLDCHRKESVSIDCLQCHY
jgi:hypothetical protein